MPCLSLPGTPGGTPDSVPVSNDDDRVKGGGKGGGKGEVLLAVAVWRPTTETRQR